MKCLAYDNTFQVQLCEKFPPWLELEKEKERQKQEEKKRAQEAPSAPPRKVPNTVVRIPKRKHSEILDSDFEEEEEELDYDEDGSDFDHEPELHYKSRGTRSRPIVL